LAFSFSQQDVLLEGVAEATASLRNISDPKTGIQPVLEILGRLAQVGHVYVYECQSALSGNTGWANKRFEWFCQEIPNQKQPVVENFFSFFLEQKQIYSLLADGKSYQTQISQIVAQEQKYLIANEIKAVLLLPIQVESQFWGVLGFEDYANARTWTTSEAQAFQLVACAIGGVFQYTMVKHALVRARQVENNERELSEALQYSASAINQSLNIKEVLEQILKVLDKVVPNDSANIMLIEDDKARMTAWRGYDQAKEIQVSTQVRDINQVPNMVKMFKTGQPVVVPDTKNSSDWVQFETSWWINSYVSAPIRHNGKTIGFFNLNSGTPGFYSTKHAERLCAFADQAAIAIENARLYEQAQQEITERKKAERELQQTLTELEIRVENRTQDLRRANEQLSLELDRRQEAEKALEEERALLALRVEERTVELSLANIELTKAGKLKDAFLASMSHELRTPLNAILNITETLREHGYGPIAENQSKALRTIEESGEHLLALINDILDLSKIGAGKLELLMDEVEVNLVSAASLQIIQEAARKKNLVVSSTIDPQVKIVWADARRLRQILVNLLSNAVKFTPNGGSIGLAVTGDCDKKKVSFTVWDSGIGIPAENFKTLFKPFTQLDNRLARNYEGTGLGLALVYSLVELHGGGIYLESEVDRGSSFTIILNWEEENAALPPSVPQNQVDEPTFTSGEVVNVDPVLQFRQCCNELGIDTDSFWFEPESVQKAIQKSHDLFLIDVRLFVKERELLDLIRNSSQTKNTPIVMLTRSRQVTGRSTLPLNITFLEYPFSCSDVRQIMRHISPGGTASLMRHVAIFVERNDAEKLSRPTIMVAIEDQTSKRILSNYLSAIGYRITQVSNKSEVIERARETHPDLLLFDVQLPGTEGLETIKRIRRDTQISNLPVISISMVSITGDRDRCLEAGADEYLHKPLNLNQLTNMIESRINIRQEQPTSQKKESTSR
jgi:signal transduction histidine kinase/CheY-like chemotaxis protein